MTNTTMANEPEPLDCVCYRLRRTARTAARSYDKALRPSGLRNTQFTLLASLNGLGETRIGDLSEKLAIDGTTLTRNPEVLVRRGLIENISAEDARVRNVRLTGLGQETYEGALPLWRQAQKLLLEAIDPDRWGEMAAQLARIEGACDGS